MSELNAGQKAAATGFFSFLFDTQPEAIISGPGGVGKTFLMSHMIDEILPQYFDACKLTGIAPEFDGVVMCATTNKAAEVLAVATQRPTQTIHSFMNLKVTDDFATGESKITPTRQWCVHEKKIIFIDECSMIDRDLYRYLRDGTKNCKLVFVGDHCQLAPIKEKLSPVYKDPKPFWVLDEQMRNNGQPALMAVCDQLRATVESGEFKPIQIVPGVIDHLNDEQLVAELENQFITQTMDSRVLAYTNNRVMLYNDHIRSLRGLPDTFTVGEYLVNNSAIHLPHRMLSVEEELTVVKVSPDIEDVVVETRSDGPVTFQIRRMDFVSRVGEELYDIKVPVDRNHFLALMKYYAKNKNWGRYFEMKNYYPDLRPRDAATFHKSQGSTYDSVFIDLTDLSTCRQADQAARMLYVALSRARHRVFLYGTLADKFGGLIH